MSAPIFGHSDFNGYAILELDPHESVELERIEMENLRLVLGS
jgi:hypothetical protein